jgi:hypothetical protein
VSEERDFIHKISIGIRGGAVQTQADDIDQKQQAHGGIVKRVAHYVLLVPAAALFIAFVLFISIVWMLEVAMYRRCICAHRMRAACENLRNKGVKN